MTRNGPVAGNLGGIDRPPDSKCLEDDSGETRQHNPCGCGASSCMSSILRKSAPSLWRRWLINTLWKIAKGQARTDSRSVDGDAIGRAVVRERPARRGPQCPGCAEASALHRRKASFSLIRILVSSLVEATMTTDSLTRVAPRRSKYTS